MPYSESYFIARESWRDWRIEARELIRLARIESGAHVLEIGCGGGGMLQMLGKRRVRAVGVDTLDVALRLAHTSSLKEKSPALAQISGDNRLPFADDTFDAILGQHVLEHIADTHAALREWRRVLKSNGRLALATPNAQYPDPAHFAEADHTRIFSPNELGDALTRAGFIIEESLAIFAFLSRGRVFRALGVVGYELFRRVPYFAERGRTILLAAYKSET